MQHILYGLIIQSAKSEGNRLLRYSAISATLKR